MSKDYEVGYGKPPKHTQFKPGQSGNPKGRRKGRKNVRTIMNELMEQPVAMQVNGRKKNVKFLEAYMRQLAAKALNGSTRDQIALLKAVHDFAPELLTEPEIPAKIEVCFVESDGNGGRADRSQRADRQRERDAAEAARRNDDPAVIAAWQAAGLDDEDDEAPAE